MENQQMEEKIRKKIRAEGAWGWGGNVRNAGVKAALYLTITLKACNFYTLREEDGRCIIELHSQSLLLSI